MVYSQIFLEEYSQCPRFGSKRLLLEDWKPRKHEDIFHDRCIPDNSGFKLFGMAMGLDQNARVKELIDGDLGQWKHDLIFSCFDPLKAMNIVSIPL